jgi:hypothetical protein
MPDYKRQHYVPRFYLAAFSPDRGKSIGIFNLGRKKLIPAGGLYSQCYENYFYGDNPQVEKHLSDALETPASVTIKEVIQANKLPAPRTEDYANLLAFTVFQANRTLGISQEAAELVKESADKLLNKMAAASGQFTPEELNDVELTLDRPVNLALQHAAGILPLVLDMKAKLLVNNTQREFITSDDPVANTNQYLLGAFEGGVAGSHIRCPFVDRDVAEPSSDLQTTGSVDPRLLRDAGVASVILSSNPLVPLVLPAVDPAGTMAGFESEPSTEPGRNDRF